VRVRVAFSLVEVLSIDENTGQLAVKAWLTMASIAMYFYQCHLAADTSKNYVTFFCTLLRPPHLAQAPLAQLRYVTYFLSCK